MRVLAAGLTTTAAVVPLALTPVHTPVCTAGLVMLSTASGGPIVLVMSAHSACRRQYVVLVWSGALGRGRLVERVTINIFVIYITFY